MTCLFPGNREIGGLVVQASEKILDSKIDEQKDKELVEKAVESIK